MSYYNDDQSKIRRRKVSSSNIDQRSSNRSKNVKMDTSHSNINKSRNSIDRQADTRTRKTGSRSKKVKKKNKNKLLKRIIKSFLVVVLVVLIMVSMAGSALVFTVLKDSPKVNKELLKSNYLSSEVVDNTQIPKYLKDAFVSIEDERFYKHNGVDTISLVRSLLHNILNESTQGGSTIEMQISKNLLTNNDKTIKRKIKDIYNATSMNKNMSKEEILEVYLNNIYLGRSSYGVAKGAKAYFGKSVSELSLAECAMLAGITNNPAIYGEYSQAKKRQETILYKMKELGYINDVEYKNALHEDVLFVSEIK